MTDFINTLPPALLTTIVVTLGGTVAAALGYAGAKLAARSAARTALAVAKTNASVTLEVAETAAKATLEIAELGRPDPRDGIIATLSTDLAAQRSLLTDMQAQINQLVARQQATDIRLLRSIEYGFALRGDLLGLGVAPEALRPWFPGIHID